MGLIEIISQEKKQMRHKDQDDNTSKRIINHRRKMWTPILTPRYTRVVQKKYKEVYGMSVLHEI